MFPRDLPLLRGLLDRLRPALVVLDPLLAYIDLAYSSINDQAVRQVLTPLAQLAAEFDCAFLLIRHLNKSGGTKAMYRGSGSIGIVGTTRLAFLVGKHPGDETARVLAPVKSNLGPMPLAVAWRLVNHPALKMDWLGEVEFAADDLVTPVERQEDRPGTGREVPADPARRRPQTRRPDDPAGPRHRPERANAGASAGRLGVECRRAGRKRLRVGAAEPLRRLTRQDARMPKGRLASWQVGFACLRRGAVE